MSWPFDSYRAPADFDLQEFSFMLAGLRGFLGSVAQSAPPPELLRSLREDLDGWQKVLAPHLASDDDSPYGQLDGAADHGLASLPELTIHDEAPGTVDATVTFSRWHVGGGGTVHGGQVATALDALMGRSQLADGWIARTAYLNVSYRAGTPWGRPVQAEVRTATSQGRKQFLHGRLFDDQTTFAEAEALFVRVDRYPGHTCAPRRETPETS
ncbi:PaaI family thioesterase [Nocardioides pacificus]